MNVVSVSDDFNPQTKPVDYGRQSACRLLFMHSHHCHLLLLLSQQLILSIP